MEDNSLPRSPLSLTWSRSSSNPLRLWNQFKIMHFFLSFFLIFNFFFSKMIIELNDFGSNKKKWWLRDLNWMVEGIIIFDWRSLEQLSSFRSFFSSSDFLVLPVKQNSNQRIDYKAPKEHAQESQLNQTRPIKNWAIMKYWLVQHFNEFNQLCTNK